MSDQQQRILTAAVNQ